MNPDYILAQMGGILALCMLSAFWIGRLYERNTQRIHTSLRAESQRYYTTPLCHAKKLK